MNLRHPNIEIPEDNPFLNCKLERKKYAEILTEVVKSGDGFVLAINNEWGTGKTTFIQMWRRLLLNENFRTLYFNAWENDFDAKPMSAVLGELKSLLPETKRDKFKPLIEKGTVLVKNLIPSIAKALVGNFINIKGLDEVAEGAFKGGAEILDEEVENYVKRQKGLTDFQEELERYLIEVSEGKPLIFIVDELDRCRPNYAVEVLENIKHFFTVKGIVFVLAIDKRQLCSSINGAYGSETFDSNDYLRRFIDVEYSLPRPSVVNYCSYLFGHYGFGEFFNTEYRNRIPELQNDGESFIKFSALLFESVSLTLRQQEKIFSHARISLRSFQENNYTFPAVFIFLIYLSKFNFTLYNKIRKRELNIQEFVREIEVVFGLFRSEQLLPFVLFTDALLIYLYSNYYFEINRGSVLYTINQSDSKINVKFVSIMDKSEGCVDLGRRFLALERTNVNGVKIDYLLNKIDLLDNLI